MGCGVKGVSGGGRSGPPAAHVDDGASGLFQGFFAAEGEDDWCEGGEVGEEIFAGLLG